MSEVFRFLFVPDAFAVEDVLKSKESKYLGNSNFALPPPVQGTPLRRGQNLALGVDFSALYPCILSKKCVFICCLFKESVSHGC